MQTTRWTSAALVLALGLGGASITACHREGPAERAGKKIDRQMDRVDDAINPKGPAEKAGRSVDRAVDDTKR